MYDDEEIKKLRTEWPNMSREDKIDHFLWKMPYKTFPPHVRGPENIRLFRVEKEWYAVSMGD